MATSGKLALVATLVILTGGAVALVRSRRAAHEAPPPIASEAAPAARARSTAAVNAVPGATGAPDAGPSPEAFDCTQRNAVLVTVDGTDVVAGPLCDELSLTTGLGPIVDPAALTRFARPLLEQAVDVLLIDAALAAKGRPLRDDEVDREVTRTAPRATGVELTALRRQLRRRAGLGRLIDLLGPATVTDAEVSAEYLAGSDRWGVERGPATAEGFLYGLSPRASNAEVARARGAADRVADALRAGTPGTQTAAVKNLGTITIKASGVEPELEERVGKASAGTVLDPIRTRAGWLVVRVISAGERRARPQAEVAGDIRRTLEARRRAEEETRVLRELRQHARMTYHVRW